MATGTGNLPFPGKSYTPFDILTAEELNEDVANIESLADGTGIGDGAITTNTLAQSAVTAAKTDFGGNYSTSEVNTGFTWVDGKTIYKKTVNFGALPNNNTKNVAHGIANLDFVISISGAAYDGLAVHIPLPFVNTSASGSNVHLNNDKTNVIVVTGSNRSGFTSAYITLYYTKT